MERIAQLIKKIQDVYYKPGTAEIIDFDLMLDYTRVLYADLLEQRGQTLAAQGMGFHLTNAGKAKVQSESTVKQASPLESNANNKAQSYSPLSGEEDEEIILNLGANSPMYFPAGASTIEEELDARQLAAKEENVPRLDFSLIDNRNKSKNVAPEPRKIPQTKVDAREEVLEPEPKPKIELVPEIVLEAAPEPVLIPEPQEIVASEPEVISKVEEAIPETEKISSDIEVEVEPFVDNLEKNGVENEAPIVEKVSEKTIQIPIPPIKHKDIRSFIGINDKYQFMNELFANNKAAFEETLDTIAQKPDAHSAELWLVEEHAIKNNWKLEDETFLELLTIVKRYFSAV